MKKITLAIAVTLITGLTVVYATEKENINGPVATSFKQDFSNASDVKWIQEKNYAKASFKLNNQVMFAYYTENGELLAVTRNILSDHLPILLLADLKKTYSNYWISDLFEMSAQDETDYYVSLENADETLILKSNGYSVWTVYKRTKKNKI